MNVSIYQAAAGLGATNQWQEILAENLAASSIPGFKRQELSFSAVQAGVMAGGANPGVGAQAVAIPKVTATTNFAQGEMRFTGAKTDLGIEGNAFFEVQLPGGQTGYTRDGEFHVTAAGQVVTKQGFPVLGDNGPIQIDPRNPAPLTISAKGDITQGIEPKGKVKLVGFDDPQKLTRASGGFYLANGADAQPTAAPEATVRQGYLETSNVTPVLEMAHLMSSMRGFEANQRMIQLHDERMQRAITELGSPN